MSYVFQLVKKALPSRVKRVIRQSIKPRRKEMSTTSASAAGPGKKKARFESKLAGVPAITADRIDRFLWAGFARTAVDEAERVRYSPEASRLDLEAISWSLGRWYFASGDYDRAVEHLNLLRVITPKTFNPHQWMLLTLALLHADKTQAAQQVAMWAVKNVGPHPELLFSAAATQRNFDEGKRLELLNTVYLNSGLAAIAPRDEDSPLHINNLYAQSPGSEIPGPMISIIMPCYNCARTLEMAARSVLAQTWRNIELIIVDDMSTDNSWELANRIASTDPRVRLLRQPTNGGAYLCRNSGLKIAEGDYVTVNDADDWAHPQKIELQARVALQGSAPNCTSGMRVLWDLTPAPSAERGRARTTNLSSMLFPRQQLLDLGGWAPIRFAADDELIQRYNLAYGAQKHEVLVSVPLTLILSSPTSLTGAKGTGKESIKFGARREVKDSYESWHEKIKYKNSTPVMGENLPFPVPNISRPDRKSVTCDVLYISDFSLPGGTTGSNVAMWRAGSDAQFSQGALHWPRIGSAGRAKNPKIVAAIEEGLVDPVVPGERVQCKLVVVNHPNILSNIPDSLPDVRAEAGVIIFNQAPMTRGVGGRQAYITEQVLSNFRSVFEIDPFIAPLSPLIRRLVKDDTGHSRFTTEDWTPLIRPSVWKRDPRGPADGAPIVGRHGRDADDKWPDDKEKLAAAHCVGTPVEFRVLGGARVAETILGYRPANWRVHPFDSMPAPEFLKGLDFYVYFPQDEMFEAFGRAPMEAMATGMPVILPEKFREIFGDAALYAQHDEVYSIIQSLWRDPAAYFARVEEGWRYVREVCASENFERRVSRLISLNHETEIGGLKAI